jgi:type IV secretory pathway VirB10-like protein
MPEPNAPEPEDLAARDEALDPAILDPARSPNLVAVRRVNNVPLVLLGGTAVLFAGVVAYVAVGRAGKYGAADEQKTVRSSRDVAEEIVGARRAGEVLAPSDLAPTALTPFSDAVPPTPPRLQGGTLDNSPVQSGDLDDFPAPPPDPALMANLDAPEADPAAGEDGLGSGPHPSSVARESDEALQPAQSERADGYSAGAGRPNGEDPLETLRQDWFQKALRSPTTVADMVPTEGDKAPAGPMSGEGRSYAEKLEQLQRAGLLQGSEEPEAGNGTTAGGAYARYDAKPGEDRWQLGASIEAPHTPYELRAGAVLPATMLSGINSELPGQITALVTQDVRDTATGEHVLIPQTSRLVGTYGSDVHFGQERLLVAWQRIVFPDGKALDLGAMPGADGAGFAGLSDRVHRHYFSMFAGAAMLSGITAGVAMSQQSTQSAQGQLSFGGAMSESLGQQFGQLSEELIRKHMERPPTLEIRPGYRFNVQVTKDLVFSSPYRAYDYARRVQVRGGVNE